MVLDCLGFPAHFVLLIMLCISSVCYNILHNRKEFGPIIPSRGFCQGCPLSPYLCFLCAESFSALLKKVVAQGSIHGCQVARGAPTISNLFFADDGLLFFKSNIGGSS